MNKKIRFALLLVISAAAAKRSYPNAKLLSLIKRFIGWMAARLLVIPTPRIVSGSNCRSQIGDILKEMRCRRPLVVTDNMLVKHGVVMKCTESLTQAGLQHVTFDAVVPNPNSELVEQGHELYKKGACDSILAIGGGSPMDVAKVIGAKVCNPKDVEGYQGFFQVNQAGFGKPLPPLVAVPTTAGTGSEATVAAVITLAAKKKKIAIADLGLVPLVAVLDPELLTGLPKHVTSATGMDALTHAVESFLSGWSTEFTRKHSLQATEKIFRHLQDSYRDGGNMVAREQMLTASLEAGMAFTRASVGYVHAIAHQLGGIFHVPHGDANAMLMPYVLEFYVRDEKDGSQLFCTKMYCELAKAAGLIASDATANAEALRDIAQKFIDAVSAMNSDMKIPAEVKEMKASDVKDVARRALAEAHGEQHGLDAPLMALLDLGYPVPKYMAPADCEEIVAKVLPTTELEKWKKGCGHF